MLNLDILSTVNHYVCQFFTLYCSRQFDRQCVKTECPINDWHRRPQKPFKAKITHFFPTHCSQPVDKKCQPGLVIIEVWTRVMNLIILNLSQNCLFKTRVESQLSGGHVKEMLLKMKPHSNGKSGCRNWLRFVIFIWTHLLQSGVLMLQWGSLATTNWMNSLWNFLSF